MTNCVLAGCIQAQPADDILEHLGLDTESFVMYALHNEFH